jgi:hypothetical protein
LFVQDNIAVTQDLTLNLGLRYENQTFTDDGNNVAPRVGFAYRMPWQRPTVVRGSYGLYYSEVHSNLAAAYNVDGPEGIFTFSAAPGQLGFPTSLAPLSAFPPGAILPPRDINIRVGRADFYNQFFDVSRLRFYPDALLNPYTQQWSFGIQRELAPRWVLSLDYVGQHSLDIEQQVDLNAPDPFDRTAPGQVRSAADADATRPITPVPNGFRRILATVNSGAATYNGLQLDLRKRFGSRFSADVSYTWSHTINTAEPDVPRQDPNDFTQLGSFEKASSLLDQRHRLSLSGWYDFPWQVRLGTWISAASGRHFNLLTGVDNNGDGSNSDRPFVDGRVLPRNFGDTDPVFDVSMFAEKEFSVTERLKLSARAEAFNLFNRNNVVGVNAVYGNLPSGEPVPTFGSPLGGINNVDPGRQFQFVFRLRF